MESVRFRYGPQGEKREMIQKLRVAMENFTGSPDILRVTPCPFGLCGLDGICPQQAETKLCVSYEQHLTQSSLWDTKPQQSHQAPAKVRHFSQ